MKFYGHGIVWDRINNRPLAKFNNGVLVTEDPLIVAELLKLDYTHDQEPLSNMTKEAADFEQGLLDGLKAPVKKKATPRKAVTKK